MAPKSKQSATPPTGTPVLYCPGEGAPKDTNWRGVHFFDGAVVFLKDADHIVAAKANMEFAVGKKEIVDAFDAKSKALEAQYDAERDALEKKFKAADEALSAKAAAANDAIDGIDEEAAPAVDTEGKVAADDPNAPPAPPPNEGADPAKV